MPENKPVALVILDGFGLAAPSKGNTVYNAHTPHIDALLANYPHTALAASGNAVGLPDGYMGNSEVGHISIGAGRVVEQTLIRMNRLLSDTDIHNNPVIRTNFSALASSKKTVHLMGLLSDAGVHSHIDHLFAFIDLALFYGIHQIYIHPFLDGRDVPTRSAEVYLTRLQKKIEPFPSCTIASITGRFYAMDRDRNWQRTHKTYAMLTEQKKAMALCWQEAISNYYADSLSDEFIPPTSLLDGPLLQDGDGILFFNIRPDRARQLTASFVEQHFTGFKKKPLSLAFFITPLDFNHTTYAAQPLLSKLSVPHTLKEVLSEHNKTMYSIAETEKYAHITYFFNGEHETMLPHEARVLVPSIRAETYREFPAMSAHGITQAVIASLKTCPRDFYLINYANADMVGHSGDLQATTKAVECLDGEIQKLYEAFVVQRNGTLIITADHGKAEQMLDAKTGKPHTAHTMNPVPFIYIKRGLDHRKEPLPLTGLSDIAPFILNKMHLPVPDEMQKKSEITCKVSISF